MRRIALILVIGVVALILGCSSDNPIGGGTATMTIQAGLSGLAANTNVSFVGLRVSGSDFQPIERETVLVAGAATFELELPVGTDRLFEMWAAAADSTILFAGDTTADVVTGLTTKVDILLEPQVQMLRFAPAFNELHVGERDTIDIMIYNIDSLFGATFVVSYLPQLVHIDYDTAALLLGDLFAGEDPIRFQHVEPPDTGLRFLAVTLKNNNEPQGLSGSGSLLRLVYTATAPGDCPFEFLEFEDHGPMMINWRGESLPRTGELYIEPGEVRVIE